MPDKAPATGSPQSLSGLVPFLKPYSSRIALALLFLVLAAAATLAFPIALRELIDGGLKANSSDATKAAQLLALRGHFFDLFLVAVALGLFSAARFFTVSWLGERITADLRNAVYAKVLRQSPEFFETTQTGEVLSRLTADTTLVQTVVGSSLSMGLRNAVMGIGALAMLVWTNPRVMITVLGILLLIVLPVLLVGRRVRKLSRASQDRVADSSAIAAEVLNAIPVVQSYTAENRESSRFDASTQRAFQTAVRRSMMRSALVAFIIIATSAALLWGLFQGTQAVVAGYISAGHLGQTVVYVIILAGAFAVLGEVYGDLLRAAGATERLMELLHAPERIVSKQNKPLNIDFHGVESAQNAIEFIATTFHYPSRPAQASLQALNLKVQRGETLALVGESGAGKTTVFQLLQRFYEPQQGRIEVFGTRIEELSLTALRSSIAVVPQDAVIFSASALENIRYGRPDASDEEVKIAAKDAFADDFIRQLPEGYDTFLGERGVRLSGGQRQRLAIARAMLKNAPILLLDEATSALDAQSEQMVQAALERAMQGRTTLVIAHRLATIQKADRIAVLQKGQLVEIGTHEALIAQAGVYAKLAALQFRASTSQTDAA
ncbi:ABC transporter transmembrane domain-containing protein [Variovorax sp. PCZ-1]|uniref:ABC transporter transmembrane domain-containing protein n=1 Tax=Variovorax sp. PCZ-1 TaxID=2835533 RepID=UPI001BCD27A7|nr:ABC transporter transmembrane domain-containing protein [Variovorax sp. PCZ-1]MBS7807292.1 ATP-binding cassette domain-containing protein [Variovorax sp. PCZ-1]